MTLSWRARETGDGISKQGVEALVGSSKQGGELAITESCVNKGGTVKGSSVAPPMDAVGGREEPR